MSAPQPHSQPRVKRPGLTVAVLLATLMAALGSAWWTLSPALGHRSPDVVLPLGAVLILLVGLATAFLSTHVTVDATPRPVRRRLALPLAAMVVSLTCGAGGLLWLQHRQHQELAAEGQVGDVSRDLLMLLDQQAYGLAMAALPMTLDEQVQKALWARDATYLQAAWGPMFETLRREHRLTHLYFLDRDRVCLLRLHKPAKRGDLINRFTAIQAQQTGRASAGLEIGPMGTLTLRVVVPVIQDKRLLGFVEFGKEIEDVLEIMHGQNGTELAVTIRKDRLIRRDWEEGMKLLGREANWDRLPDSVLVYRSESHLPESIALLPSLGDAGATKVSGATSEADFGGKSWQVTAAPLTDVSGAKVATLFIFRDISGERATFVQLLTIGGTASMVLASLLLGLIYVLLRRTDLGIAAQQMALRRNEESLSATLRSIADGVVVCDAAGRVINFNAKAERLTGWAAQTALGAPVHEVVRLVQPDSRLVVASPVAQALEDDRVVEVVEHTVLASRAGEERRIAANCAPVHDDAGAVLGAVLVFRDTTEEYLRSRALSESEERYRTVADFTFDFEYLADHHQRFTYVSPSCARVTGFSAAAFLEDPNLLERIVHPGDLEAYRQHVATFHGAPDICSEFEFRIIHQDHQVRYIQHACQPVVDDHGVTVGRRISNRDATATKLAEQDLRNRIALEDLLVSMSSAFIHVDDRGLDALLDEMLQRVGQFVGVDRSYLFRLNRVAGTMSNTHEWCAGGIGAEKEGLQDLPCSLLPRWMEVLERNESICVPELAALPPDWVYERALLEPQGIKSLLVLPVSVGLELMGFIGFDSVREPRGWGAVDRNLLHLLANNVGLTIQRVEQNRALVLATEAAHRMAEEKDRASRVKSEFLANMSHEIRTPMNAILGFAQVLERDPALTPWQDGHLKTIIRSGGHLLGLINDVLDMSKIEAGRITLDPVVFNLQDLLDDLAAVFRSRCEARDLRLVIDRAEGVPAFIRADEGKLRQVFVNLLGNAAKFTQEGGIALRVGAERLGPEGTQNLALQVEVEDSGPGIDQQDLARIFVPFQQAEVGVRAGGTGLGLAISRQFVEAMGGQLTVTSQVGKGSIFRFTVLVEEAPPEPDKKTLETRRVLGLAPGDVGLKVLVVDDQPDNRTVLRELLIPLGFDIREATNGSEALQEFARWEPKAVLMDMRMPVMDGYEATRQLRATEAGRTVLVVAVTASAFEYQEARVMAAGVDAYVRKPFRPEELFAALGEGLGLEYEYGEAGPTDREPVGGPTPVGAAPLVALPRALVRALRVAVEEGDGARLEELIIQARVLDSGTADKLAFAADEFDYTKLLRWTREDEEYNG